MGGVTLCKRGGIVVINSRQNTLEERLSTMPSTESLLNGLNSAAMIAVGAILNCTTQGLKMKIDHRQSHPSTIQSIVRNVLEKL